MGKEENQTTPDLSRIMMEGRPVFGADEDAEAGGAPVGSGAPGPGTEEKGAGAAEAGGAGKTETDQEAAEEAAAAGGATETKGATPGEDKTPGQKTPRFKSHDEAEDGYRELQGKTTKVEQENATLRRQLAEAGQKLTAAERAEAEKQARAEQRKGIMEFSKQRKKEALAAIDGLDPDSPDYQDQAAQILAEADVDIQEYIQDARAAAKPAADEKGAAAPGDKGEAAAKEGEKPAGEAAAGEAGTEETAMEQIRSRLKEAGMEEEDEMFMAIASHAPSTDKDGKRIPFDRQIEWAIEKTKTYNARQAEKNRKAQEKAADEKGRQHQEENLPLGRGGQPGGGSGGPGGGKPASESKPTSLADAIDNAKKSRVL